jgi:hypothetical protein
VVAIGAGIALAIPRRRRAVEQAAEQAELRAAA